jgi:hypothetical protein
MWCFLIVPSNPPEYLYFTGNMPGWFASHRQHGARKNTKLGSEEEPKSGMENIPFFI